MNNEVLKITLEETFPYECTIVGDDALAKVINSLENEESLTIHFAKGGNDFDYSTAIEILKIAGEIIKIAIPIITSVVAAFERKALIAEIKRHLPTREAILTDEQVTEIIDKTIKNIK